MKIFAISWSSYLPLMKRAAEVLGIDLLSYSTKVLSTAPEIVKKIQAEMLDADLILLYRTNDPFWGELEDTLSAAKKSIPVVVTGSDPTFMALSNVSTEIAFTVYRYLIFNGFENIQNMFCYLLSQLFQKDLPFSEPVEIPWEGIHHPRIDGIFEDTESFLRFYQQHLLFTPKAFVGLLYPRTNWVTGNMEVEKAFIESMEKLNFGVVPVFLYSLKDDSLGNLSGRDVVERFFLKDGRPIVEGVVKLTSFFLGSGKGDEDISGAKGGVDIFKQLNIPLFNPVISYYRSKKEWLEDPEGLGVQVAWSIALPEFEGVIEPLVIGAVQSISGSDGDIYAPFNERIERMAQRVARWLELRKKPNSEKKVAFILHNNPCASLEGTVGGGAHLDTLESVVVIMRRMKEQGYDVIPPESGSALIEEIMEKKAISEFRWTTVEEIVDKGGVLDFVDREQYEEWFEELQESSRERMCAAWGDPPGTSMVYEGKILITGVRFGNVVICVQPKRGCAGARCDGEVCKILHDPSVPPPHHYVATYRWLSRIFKTDVIVHVGTHGNLEFLPGKSSGLSQMCFPDIAVDSMPHLYIYNADNPAEGTVAKRRSYAVIVDHMQTVLVKGELYGEMEELERLLEEYRRYEVQEPAKAHTIAHMIHDKAKQLNLLEEEIETGERTHNNFQELHERLSLMKSTFFPEGMHVFGEVPCGEKLADFVYSIIRFDDSSDAPKSVLRDIIARQGLLGEDALEEKIDECLRDLCRNFVLGRTSLRTQLEELYTIKKEDHIRLAKVEERIKEVIVRIEASDEIGSFLNGLSGGYIEPGPSGLITRGRSDVLPTGRNFYSLDPRRIPTPSAWLIGIKLAEKTVERFFKSEGRYPENIAFYWQCSDIMWSGGEGMAMMMYLMGVKPVWDKSGRVKGFEVIPLSEIGRPRIDVTVRVSGITRDNFPGCIELLDEIVQHVASLDELPEWNFVKKHTFEKIRKESAQSHDHHSVISDELFRKYTYRIFASMPGTYQAGTQLAVYASAWRSEADLAEVFVRWNGYAYGKGVFGTPAHEGLRGALRTVEVTFNKAVTDEYDLTSCCGYFGTHGGMINATRVLTGKDVKNFYGDTREPNRVTVRTLAEEIQRIARAKILNPRWIESMKRHGYKGASEISKRVGRLYGWQATAKEVDGTIFDDIARTFVMNEENRRFFAESNPWALEEMARRLLEATERGLWTPSPDVEGALREIYMEIEGFLEERMENVRGDFQGGNIDIYTVADASKWREEWEESK
ncbi:MAG: cobaltochelatase subunit CobN [Syntrophales bacterium]|nr:cobaltochelatase subunit CobN [Syntrophales bacterium]